LWSVTLSVTIWPTN
jgi:hypothetical protein